MTNIAAEIRKFVAENFLFDDAGSLEDSTSFIESGVIDSTGILELVTFLEMTYEIKVESEDMVPENFDSIDKITRFLTKKLGAKTTGAEPAR